MTPSEREQHLKVRAAKLEQALWHEIADSKEDNITVILSALATLINRMSEYSMKAEAEETAN